LLDGAVQESVTVLSPGVPETPAGTPGRPAGVSAALAADSEPVPTPLVAATVNV
jgi:hypothetical protein